tara:strand:- start:1017 stop:1388 length:372 start_codon:yes stop_codon:yes gene_type:complete
MFIFKVKDLTSGKIVSTFKHTDRQMVMEAAVEYGCGMSECEFDSNRHPLHTDSVFYSREGVDLFLAGVGEIVPPRPTYRVRRNFYNHYIVYHTLNGNDVKHSTYSRKASALSKAMNLNNGRDY